MTDEVKYFNIRVYAIIIKDNHVLLSDEYFMDMRMTKFPGGGLRLGESTIECLEREALEEFHQEIEIVQHFYTTDFYQRSLFFKDHQLISIYYLARFKEEPLFPVSDKPFDFEDINGNQSFRWLSLDRLVPEIMTFPIDKKVAGMLRDKFSHK